MAAAMPVRVAVRVRPMLGEELSKGCGETLGYVHGEPSLLVGIDTPNPKQYTFDFVYGANGAKENTCKRLYRECVSPLLDGCLKGFNATVLAYGQTGSGKTYTMGTDDSNMESVIPMVAKDVFRRTQAEEQDGQTRYTIKVSFLEIHREIIRDLLNGRNGLNVREDTNGTVFVHDLSEEVVKDEREMRNMILKGCRARATGSTGENINSSRSHAIMTVTIIDNSQAKVSKFHLVDLAGSERAKRTKAQGKRLQEGIDINKGLLCLGNVISALGDESKGPQTHIPYRDSKLTRLLQDSLGGNSRTLMIACASPADINFHETLRTLKYAHRARNIKNKPMAIMEDKSEIENKLIIHELRQQLSSLKKELLTASNHHQQNEPKPEETKEYVPIKKIEASDVGFEAMKTFFAETMEKTFAETMEKMLAETMEKMFGETMGKIFKELKIIKEDVNTLKSKISQLGQISYKNNANPNDTHSVSRKKVNCEPANAPLERNEKEMKNVDVPEESYADFCSDGSYGEEPNDGSLCEHDNYGSKKDCFSDDEEEPNEDFLNDDLVSNPEEKEPKGRIHVEMRPFPMDEAIKEINLVSNPEEKESKGRIHVEMRPFPMDEAIKEIMRLDQNNWFTIPVEKLWPKHAEKYLNIIKNPMDLQTICSKSHKYKSPKDLQADLDLIFENCVKYNGKDHQFSLEAKKLIDFSNTIIKNIDFEFNDNEAKEIFAAMWPKYKKQKWKCRAGKGLYNYFYFAPGVKTRDGILNVNKFGDLKRLVKHWISIELNDDLESTDDDDLSSCSTIVLD